MKEKKEIYTPQTLEEARTHYCPPNKKAITCKNFGNYDTLNQGCGYCLQLHPYEAEMCADETRRKEILALNPVILKNRELADEFIEKYKNKFNHRRD